MIIQENRQQGNPDLFSVLNVHKPAGLTSHDVVAKVRKTYGLRKVGHLGTLDPMAEGVLPVCLGKATRLIEYFPSDKRYQAEITFGKTTTTLDREGELLEARPCPHLTAEAILAAIPPFVGTIEQEVPLHSAVHVDGKKLYKYAQQGIAVKPPTRTAVIHEIALLTFDASEPDFPKAVIDVHCASGTYIRAIARDLGNALGCGAHLSALLRTAHGLFTLADATPLSEIQETQYPQQFLKNPVHFLDLTVLPLSDDEEYRLLTQGMKVVPAQLPQRLKGNETCFIEYQGQPVAVARYEEKKLRPLKVFASQDA